MFFYNKCPQQSTSRRLFRVDHTRQIVPSFDANTYINKINIDVLQNLVTKESFTYKQAA